VHVAFVPGSSTRPSTTNGPNVFNPWEPEALAEAVVIPLKTKELADSMRASGYKGEWTAENGIGTLAVVVITVTSSTPADSVRTAQHLVDLVFEDVKQRQTPLRLTPGETIKANQIEPAPTVEKKSMKIIRSAVVIGAAGLILTLGLVLAVDALMRRRNRRRMGGGSLSASALAHVPGSPFPSAPLPGVSSRARIGSMASDTNDHTIVLNRVVAVDPVDPIRLPAATESAPVSSSPISPSPIITPSQSSSPSFSSSVPSPREGIEISYETGRSVDEDDADSLLPEDSTVVLPLSNSPGWRHNNGGKPTATRP